MNMKGNEMRCTNRAEFGLTTNTHQRKACCPAHLKDALDELGASYVQPLNGAPFGCDVEPKLPFGFSMSSTGTDQRSRLTLSA